MCVDCAIMDFNASRHLDGSVGQTVLSCLACCRENEDAFVQQRDERKPGGEWERVCRLCDFNPKSSRNSKDITRMRSILLQLKQAPTAASAER